MERQPRRDTRKGPTRSPRQKSAAPSLAIEGQVIEASSTPLDLPEIQTSRLLPFNPKVAAMERAEIQDTKTPLGQYFRDISRIPLLTPTQEVEFAKKIEQGNTARATLMLAEPEQVPNKTELEAQVAEAERVRRLFVESNTRLVVSVAKRYIGRGMSFWDLIQEGNIGAMKAVEKFDYRKGFKFSTYATWWIRQAVTRALADHARTIRLPMHVGEFLRRYYRLDRRLTEDLGQEPLIEEIAAEMDTTPERTQRLLKAAQLPLQMSLPVGDRGDNEGTELGDLLEDFGAHDRLEKAGETAALRRDLDDIMASLTRRERQVLELRYGFDADGDGDPVEPMTLDDIAERIINKATGKPITRERVRQIEDKALKKLRHPSRSKKLRDYLE